MTDVKSVIAKNITELRTSGGMTQIELADKLHYSDKAVSKWERGESVPEINTLVAIADLFGVPLDWIVRDEHTKAEITETDPTLNTKKRSNRILITGLSILLVWLVATAVYVLIDIISSSIHTHWIAFIFAVPGSMIVWLIFNSIWFNRRRNFLIVSLLVWSLLCSLHFTFLAFGLNIWQLYIIGIPSQLIIFVWSRLQFSKTPINNKK